jgi:Spondin_N
MYTLPSNKHQSKMRKMIPSVLLAALMAATTTTTVAADDFKVSAKTTSRLAISEMTMYSCVFTNQWTAANHPNLYPTGSAHWSPPVVATHDTTYEMWSAGAMASMGVELVAEVCTLERTSEHPKTENCNKCFVCLSRTLSLTSFYFCSFLLSFCSFFIMSPLPLLPLSCTRPVKLPFWNPNWKSEPS